VIDPCDAQFTSVTRPKRKVHSVGLVLPHILPDKSCLPRMPDPGVKLIAT
jgi:hypothetical protein